MVASTRPNSRPRPGNLKYAKPNATIELETATAVAASRAIATLFQSQLISGSWFHTST